jgi:hypothetical protein
VLVVAKAMPPLWQYFLLRTEADERIFAPKGHRPRTSLVFGLTMRFAAPGRGRRGLHHRPRPKLSVKPVPPLWQYFSGQLRKPLAPMAAPKGHGPRHPRLFLLQKPRFWGAAVGATIVIMDPGAGPRRERLGRTRGAAVPPLWQYFSRLQKQQLGAVWKKRSAVRSPRA